MSELPVESWGEPCGNFLSFRHQSASFRAPGAAHASAHAICSELGPVNFCFKWRHRDGSTIEFSANGWSSDDPAKADWLSKMNQLHGSNSDIPTVVRDWLKQECELIDIRGPGV